MANLRIRLRFNPGRVGSPMGKLGEFSTQMERFLRSLSADLGIDAQRGKWLAKNFTNESVAFDGEYADFVDDAISQKALAALEGLSGPSPLGAFNSGYVGYSTLAEFAKVGKLLDPDEVYYIGLYRNGDAQPDWKSVSHTQTAQLRKLLETPVTTIGSVQGIMYSWHPGATQPFFQVRELITKELVRCEYEDRYYDQVHQAMESQNVTVHVYGRIQWDSVTNAIIKVLIDDIEATEPLSASEFNQFFGAAPEYTGEFSTAEYIEWLRGDGD